ncbi:hypothetical protein HYDPIDRAFT_26305 [Hydnomerulius pinastri MD-312]|nr:hypothetical protein HYDPIDRAFT_26305 [Hydnomerulius pinastri MD-312]
MGAAELRVLSKNPYNAEPPCLVELTKHAITPLRLAYARNHCTFLPNYTFESLATSSDSELLTAASSDDSAIVRTDFFDETEFVASVADIKDLKSGAEEYVVKIDAEIDGLKETSVTFKELLDSFPRKEVVAALICAGNRRAKMAEKTGRDVQGIKWSEGTISNVRWVGTPLRDVLLRAGVPEDIESYEGLHACFASNIAPCEQDSWYGGSIPLEKAMSEDGDVLLAYEMNGEPLTPDHGFPLRVVVPGYSGMRWVKWVDQITISRKESTNFYQQRDYKMLPDYVTSKDMADSQDWWSRVPSMQHLSCNSVVAQVKRLPPSCPDEIKLKAVGYAYSHCPISRAEISADGGETWKQGKITYQEGQWSWALWEVEIDIELDEDAANGMLAAYDSMIDKNGRRKTRMTVLSRAYDSAGNIQNTECPWNLRGVGFCGAGEATVEV